MRAADLREKTPEDLRELQKTLARDVFQNRLKNFTNRLDDTSAIRKARRDLARVLTLLREREPKATVATPAASAVQPAKAKKAPKAEAKSAAPAAESKPKASAPATGAAAEPAKKKSSTKAKKSEAK